MKSRALTEQMNERYFVYGCSHGSQYLMCSHECYIVIKLFFVIYILWIWGFLPTFEYVPKTSISLLARNPNCCVVKIIFYG